MRHVSIATSLGIVGLVAIGLAAMKSGTDAWTRGIVSITYLALLVSLVGVFVRPRPRAGWIGFAVFSWGFLIIGGHFRIPIINDPPMPDTTLVTHYLIAALPDLLHRPPPLPPGYAPDPYDSDKLLDLKTNRSVSLNPPDAAIRLYVDRRDAFDARVENTPILANHLLALILGLAGSVVGVTLSSRRTPPRG